MSNLQELNVVQIANYLSDKGIHWSISGLDKCASTNVEALGIVKKNPELMPVPPQVFENCQNLPIV